MAALAEHHLYRSRQDRFLGGVCGGLAAYFGVDPTIVRLVLVGLALVHGAVVVLYLLLWVLVPVEGNSPPPAGAETLRTGIQEMTRDVSQLAAGFREKLAGAASGAWIGLLLVALGVYLLLANLGLLDWLNWGIAASVLLIASGLLLLVRRFL